MFSYPEELNIWKALHGNKEWIWKQRGTWTWQATGRAEEKEVSWKDRGASFLSTGRLWPTYRAWLEFLEFSLKLEGNSRKPFLHWHPKGASEFHIHRQKQSWVVPLKGGGIWSHWSHWEVWSGAEDHPNYLVWKLQRQQAFHSCVEEKLEFALIWSVLIEIYKSMSSRRDEANWAICPKRWITSRSKGVDLRNSSVLLHSILSES